MLVADVYGIEAAAPDSHSYNCGSYGNDIGDNTNQNWIQKFDQLFQAVVERAIEEDSDLTIDSSAYTPPLYINCLGTYDEVDGQWYVDSDFQSKTACSFSGLVSYGDKQDDG